MERLNTEGEMMGQEVSAIARDSALRARRDLFYVDMLCLFFREWVHIPGLHAARKCLSMTWERANSLALERSSRLDHWCNVIVDRGCTHAQMIQTPFSHTFCVLSEDGP